MMEQICPWLFFYNYYGILFDGAWLWEEYLNTILCHCEFHHPQNNIRQGGIPVFTNDNKVFYPDFWRNDIILDAKYKRYEDGYVQSKDYHQIISYMYLMKIKRSGFIVPFQLEKESEQLSQKELVGYGGTITVYGLFVKCDCNTYSEYCINMVKAEDELKSEVKDVKENNMQNNE